MTEKRFIIEVDENRDVRILDMEFGGLDIGQYNVCRLLNNFYEEIKELREENEFLNLYIEDIEDDMFSEKDFSEYLQACHGGDVKNIKG